MIARPLLSLCLVASLFATPAMSGDVPVAFPEAIGDLARVELLTGSEAQAEVNRLHGKPLLAKMSIVGRYARPDERPAEVWVSRVADVAEARRQAGLMVHKMYENPKSPFKNPSRLTHGAFAVYRFTGMGQAHLIWYDRDLVWWVSVNPGDEETFLDVFCR